jgi:transposase
MQNQPYPTDLSNRQWDCIRELVPVARADSRPRSLDMRQVVNAILYILVSRAQWHMLPKDYPNWKSVDHYFHIWRDDGTWKRIHDTLRAALRRKLGRPKTSCRLEAVSG